MAITKKPGRKIEPKDEEQAAASFIAGAGTAQTPAVHAPGGDSKRTPVLVRFDPKLLALVDAEAKRRGISRSAWIQFTISKAIEEG